MPRLLKAEAATASRAPSPADASAPSIGCSRITAQRCMGAAAPGTSCSWSLRSHRRGDGMVLRGGPEGLLPAAGHGADDRRPPRLRRIFPSPRCRSSPQDQVARTSSSTIRRSRPWALSLAAGTGSSTVNNGRLFISLKPLSLGEFARKVKAVRKSSRAFAARWRRCRAF